jgi:hypothetical protein
LIIQNLDSEERRLTVREKIARLMTRGARRLLRAVLWRSILWIERRKIRGESIADHMEMRDISGVVSRRLSVRPIVSPSGYVYRYSADDVEKLRVEQFDLLIRCGSGILRGEILKVPRDGIVSFHHADNTVNRGGPAGFWEVYRREPFTGFIIQRLTDELDGGEVLQRGRFPTATLYLRNHANLCRRSNYYLMQMLARYLITRRLPIPERNVPYSGPLYRIPGPAVSLHYLARNVIDLVRSRVVHRLLGRRQVWGVSFVRKHWRDAALWRGQRVLAPEGRFFADPFVVSHAGRHYCLVEDFDWRLGRACISALTLNEMGAEFIDRVIVEPFHMSFPYVFEYDSKIYMVPETCKNRDIRIYEAEVFPTRWRLATIAMDNISAADTMIFQRDGLWWMFTNVNPLYEEDHSSELMIFYSDNPLGNDWRPHARNPIYIDPEKARNGGFLMDAGEMYRVAQSQGFNQYGAAAKIFRIVELSPTTYREELEAQVRPDFYPDLRGTHHMNGNEHITVFDHVQVEGAAKNIWRRNFGQSRLVPKPAHSRRAESESIGSISEV